MNRHLEIERYNGVYISDNVTCFTLWNLSGQMCGYQQYRPSATKDKKNNPRDSRYYTSVHGKRNEKPIAIWGLESLDYRSDVLVIVEGIFDACRFHNHNIPSVALLSSSWKPYSSWLFCIGRKIYKGEDESGSGLGPFTNLECPEKDFGECTGEQMREVVKLINTKF
jgi:hypothetical protein